MPEFEQRRSAASQHLGSLKIRGQGIDAVLVSSPANIRYLSGFAGSNALMLIGSGEAHFFTDPRYGQDASANIDCKVHVCKGPLLEAAAALVKRKRFKDIGFEPGWMNVAEHRRLREALPSRIELLGVPAFLEDLRAVKSAEEIALIRRSVLANSEAYARTVKRIKPGLRELEIAAELEFQMKALGCEKPAFDTIVAVGERTALPHAHPSLRRLQANELLLIDMGATLEGYTSDMTRMLYVGTPPKKVRDLYRAVQEAQLAGLEAVRPGMAVTQVDAAARKVLKQHGLEKQFVHSTGHGLGLEIHEIPKIGRPQKRSKKSVAKKKKAEESLRAGMVITIEPGAYVPGFAGVRIEDTVLVTAGGYEVLTPTPKEFLSLA